MASYLRPHDAIVALNDCHVDTVRDFAECASRTTAAHFLPAPPPQRSDLLGAPQQLPLAPPATDGAAAYGGPGAWAQDVIADAARRRQPHRGFCVRVQQDGPACRAAPGLPAEAECEGAEDLCFTSLSLQNDSEFPHSRRPSIREHCKPRLCSFKQLHYSIPPPSSGTFDPRQLLPQPLCRVVTTITSTNQQTSGAHG